MSLDDSVYRAEMMEYAKRMNDATLSQFLAVTVRIKCPNCGAILETHVKWSRIYAFAYCPSPNCQGNVLGIILKEGEESNRTA